MIGTKVLIVDRLVIKLVAFDRRRRRGTGEKNRHLRRLRNNCVICVGWGN